MSSILNARCCVRVMYGVVGHVCMCIRYILKICVYTYAHLTARERAVVNPTKTKNVCVCVWEGVYGARDWYIIVWDVCIRRVTAVCIYMARL